MPKMLTLANIMSALQTIAPLELAAEWDNVGLLIGDPAAPVERVMTCLSVTADSVTEALEGRAQLIVSHHPLLFRPIKKLTTDDAEGRMLLELIRGGIAVYSPHTAYDNSIGGINDVLAQRLGLTDIVPLRLQEAERSCKIVVFVPDADLGKVSDALFAAGAGQIGQYRDCSYRLSGFGTFYGTDGTSPTVGAKGRREEVAEWRLEVVCPDLRVPQAVAALLSAHSYEEPAYDVYRLAPDHAKVGEGRLGSLPRALELEAFARIVKSVLHAECVQIVGSAQQSVQRVAIACGAAGTFLADAVAARADVFLTGEVRFHDCLAAQAHQLALLLPGHYATERLGIETLAERLQGRLPELKVWASQRERDPLLLV